MTAPLSWKLVPLEATENTALAIHDAIERNVQNAGPILLGPFAQAAYSAALGASPLEPTEALIAMLEAVHYRCDWKEKYEPWSLHITDMKLSEALRAFTLATSESGKEKVK